MQYNYLQYIKSFQTPSSPIFLSTGDQEKDRDLQYKTQLYTNDQPLSGTDPIGEFYVSGVVGGKLLELIGSAIGKVARPIIKKAIESSGGKVSKYLKNTGQWDIELIKQDISQGILDARSFLQSTVKKETDLHNKQLAERLGYKGFSPDSGIDRVKVDPKSRTFTTDKTAPTGQVKREFFGTKSPSADEVVYNLNSKDLKATAFHEELHRGNFGEGNIFDLSNSQPLRTKLADTESFETMKIKHLLKTDMNLPYANYLREDGEVAANLLELAYRGGIKPGQQYPGTQEVINILNDLKIKFPEKAFVIDNLDINHPKRIWDALTGKYFVIGAPLLHNIYDDTQQQDQK